MKFRAVREDEIRPGARLWLMGDPPVWVKVAVVLPPDTRFSRNTAKGLKALVSWSQEMPGGCIEPMLVTVPLGDLAVQLGTEGDPLAPTKRPEADRPATQLVYPPGISSDEFGGIAAPRQPRGTLMLPATMEADSATFRLSVDGCPIRDENPDLACLAGPHTDGTVVQSECTACPNYRGHQKTARIMLFGFLVPSTYKVACAWIPRPEDR